jgi:hypothetical protein
VTPSYPGTRIRIRACLQARRPFGSRRVKYTKATRSSHGLFASST